MINTHLARMTTEEFLQWCSQPENQERFFELDEGKLIEMPPPSEQHGLFCSVIHYYLCNYLFSRNAGYTLTNDTGLLLNENLEIVRGPDIMLFLTSRTLDSFSCKLSTKIPDLVVEIFSPSDLVSRMIRKINQYLEHGVKLVWMVDPADRTLTVFQSGEFQKVLDESDELTGNGVLPDFRCKVGDLFRLPGQ